MRKALLAVVVAAVLGAVFMAGAWTGWRSATPAAGEQARIPLHYSCPMHPQYTTDHAGDCPSCGMRLEPVYAQASRPAALLTPAGAILVTSERQQAIGVRLGRVDDSPATATVRTVGRVAADETRIYRITAATNGWIEEALPNSVGSLVKKDQPLGSFYAREFLSAQQAYFYALDARDRFLAQKASDAQMAATTVQIQQSTDTLRALGMTPVQIDELGRTRERTFTIEIRAPATGFVLVRNISTGQRFDSGDELYVIADLRRVWVLADLFEYEAGRLRPGQAVSIVYEGQRAPARVSDVLPIFDAEARTMQVRLEVENPGYRFRPGMFVNVEFEAALPETLTVPVEAVIDSGLRKTVFVDCGDGYFEPRRVETGRRLGDRVEVVRGLMSGERIVISGNFLLDSESRMRAAAPAQADRKTDPVCGMEVDAAQARAAGRTVVYRGETYYFCSETCKQQFGKEPARFAARAVSH